MALKTFNVDGDVYKEFSEHCKKNGFSMSKRIDNFMREELLRIKSGNGEKKEEIRAEDSHPMGKYC